MKVAVLISGLVRSGNKDKPEFSVNDNIDRIKKVFPNADVFYSTWSSGLEQFHKFFPDEHCIVYQEPKMHYHPYKDVNPKDYTTEYMKRTAKWATTKGKTRLKYTSHHTKQILVHAWLVGLIGKHYDIVIRTRFDAYIYEKSNFAQFIKQSYNNNCAIGFACKLGYKDKFKEISDVTRLPDMDKKIHDHLIIHPPSLIDVDNVNRLHIEKKLHPAEIGWHQVLSLPHKNNHINMTGWVNNHYIKG